MDCPACGHAAPAAARFCPSCGHALTGTGDQRRIVTVVFADLVGYTSLSETRDPEHVKNLVDRCFERLAADVTAYGGRVDKVVGDAIIALFGAPVAHEDDAERAVRAALQMQATIQAHAAEQGNDVRLRIGVNTGEVLVGAVRASDDYTAMGDVVNVAQRLQTTAHPGDVVVGPSTYDSTKDVIEYEPLGPLEVRGRDGAVDAYRAVEALAPPGYRPRRYRTPLVGREPEMALLRNAFATAVRRQRPHFVLVVGEAGVGKSRLGEELANVATREHDAAIYVGRCVPYGEANPWWPVSEILRQAFAIEPTDAASVTQDKIRRGVAAATHLAGEEAERMGDGLLYLMGLEGKLSEVDPTRALDEGVAALTAVLAGIASRYPVLLFMADLHWADAVVLDLVDRLLQGLRGMPVVLVATARPELEERWSPSPGRHNLIALHLDALDGAAASELVAHLLGSTEVPSDVRSALLERSGGNPFFLEELVALLAEAGVLERGGGARAISENVRDLPATLRGLVAARLDGMPARERAVVEDAAVLGRVGSVSALVDLAGARGEHEVATLVERLVARDFVVVEDHRFEFKSELVREVAYETLTKSERARRHAAVAQWLEDQATRTGREDEHLQQLAYHYGVAAELDGELGGAVEGVPADVDERALRWLERSAERSLERDSFLSALQSLDVAVELVPPGDATRRRRLLLGRARARTGLRELAGARADLDILLGEARQDGDTALEIRALTVMGDLQQREGDAAAALVTLDRALELAAAAGDAPGRAEALRHWGMAKLFQGEVDGAEGAIAEAKAAFCELGDRRNEAWALQNLAWIAFVRGETDLADERLSASAQLFDEIHDHGGRSWAYGLLGFVRLTQGRLEEAGALAEQVVPEARKAGDRWALGMSLVLKASVNLWLGRTLTAVEDAESARAAFEAIDDNYGKSLALATLSRARVNAGRPAEARTSTEEAISAFRAQGGGMETMALNFVANLHGQLGDARAAASAFADVDLAGPEIPLEMKVARALSFVQLGRPEEALPYLEDVVEGDLDAMGPGAEGAKAYALAVMSLAKASLADVDGALEAGRTVAGGPLGTYLDRTYGELGMGLALAQTGRRDEALEALESAAQRVEATEDRLSQAVVRLARAHAMTVLDEPEAGALLDEAHQRFSAMGVDPVGWETAFLSAATGEVSTPAAGGR